MTITDIRNTLSKQVKVTLTVEGEWTYGKGSQGMQVINNNNPDKWETFNTIEEMAQHIAKKISYFKRRLKSLNIDRKIIIE